MKRFKFVFVLIFAVAAALGGTIVTVENAYADSCWDHNGSVMRLQAEGDLRWFSYEVPRSVLKRAGVESGTLLFEGRKDGDWYIGEARVFSKYCIGSPQLYDVEGPVRADQLKVTVKGTREIHKRCQPTGRSKEDVLVFTHLYDC